MSNRTRILVAAAAVVVGGAAASWTSSRRDVEAPAPSPEAAPPADDTTEPTPASGDEQNAAPEPFFGRRPGVPAKNEKKGWVYDDGPFFPRPR